MTRIPMVFFLHFLCLSLPLSHAFSIWFHALMMMIARLAFPSVCLLTQTNALISLDLGVRLCKLLFIKHIDSRAAGITNTWSNWKIQSMFLIKYLCISSFVCVCKGLLFVSTEPSTRLGQINIVDDYSMDHGDWDCLLEICNKLKWLDGHKSMN